MVAILLGAAAAAFILNRLSHTVKHPLSDDAALEHTEAHREGNGADLQKRLESAPDTKVRIVDDRDPRFVMVEADDHTTYRIPKAFMGGFINSNMKLK